MRLKPIRSSALIGGLYRGYHHLIAGANWPPVVAKRFSPSAARPERRSAAFFRCGPSPSYPPIWQSSASSSTAMPTSSATDQARHIRAIRWATISAMFDQRSSARSSGEPSAMISGVAVLARRSLAEPRPSSWHMRWVTRCPHRMRCSQLMSRSMSPPCAT